MGFVHCAYDDKVYWRVGFIFIHSCEGDLREGIEIDRNSLSEYRVVFQFLLFFFFHKRWTEIKEGRD